jgi:hypothetical protein
VPEAIGAIVLGAELAGVGLFAFFGTTVTLGAVVGGAILIAGSIGLQLLLRQSVSPGMAPGSPALPGPDSGHQALRQAIPSRISGYGESVRIAGSFMLYEEALGISWDIQALFFGQLTSINGYYLHDDVVEVDGSGIVQTLGDGRYTGGVITIKTRLGLNAETAYSEVTAALPAIWDSTYKGNGIASAMMRCESTADPTTWHNTYPRGLPQLSVVASLLAIFDPRGPVTQVSNNPVLQLIDFLTNDDRGMGLAYDTLIAPVIGVLMAEANLCDDFVTTAAGGTERRYTSRGTFPLDSDPANVVNTILDTCDGWISENGDGTLALKVGVYRAPSFVLEAEHIKGFSLQKGMADEEVVNELTIDYTAADADYKTVPGQPWQDAVSIAELGRIRSQRFALPWVYSHAQSRRLAKRRMAQLNAPIRGTIITSLFGLQALGERWIQVAASEASADLTDLVIEVRGITIDLLNAQCTFKFVSVNPNGIDAWTPATEEGSAPTIPSKLVTPPPPVPQNIEVFPIGDFEPLPPAGTFVVTIDDPGRADLTLQSAWRVNGSGDPFVNDPLTAPTIQSEYDGRLGIRGGFAIASPGTYEVKVRSFGPAGAGSAFSSSDTVVIT